jgi:hypothetical protein
MQKGEHPMPARRELLNAAKAAVRAYARDPSQSNAIEVDVAFRRVRALADVSAWRKAGKRLTTGKPRKPTMH